MEQNLSAAQNASGWAKSAWDDLETAEIDFAAGKYRHALINCHHAVEKLAKALFILQHNKLPPKTHNIVEVLRETYGEQVYHQIVSEERQNFFADLTSFYPGINYPDSSIYGLIERETAESILHRSRGELEWLQSLLKS